VLIAYVDWKKYLNYNFYIINLNIAYWKQWLYFDYYKKIQLSYHVISQHLFRPLDKKFVVFNNRSISLGQNVKQGRYKCCLQVYLTIFLDHDMLIGHYTCYVCIENLCLTTKIVLGICTLVACVLLFRMNNTILTTSYRYRCGSRMQHIFHCKRNSLLIFTSVLFIGEFLTKSNAKLYFFDNTYSEMSHSKFWLTTL
jgi:hypothetical protein